MLGVCPLSGVTSCGRVWRKVPESDARSVAPYVIVAGRAVPEPSRLVSACGISSSRPAAAAEQRSSSSSSSGTRKKKKGERKKKHSGRQIVQAWSKRPLINFSDSADESVSFFSHNCLFCSACHPAPGCPQFASLAQSASFCPRAPGSSPCLWPHSPQPVRLKTGDRF